MHIHEASSEEWLQRLKHVRIDDRTKSNMTEMEKNLSKTLDKRENKFVNNLYTQVKQNKSLSVNDVNSQIFEAFDQNSESLKEDFADQLREIIENAKQQAQKMIGKTAFVRQADNYEDSVNKAFESIDGIPEEIASKLKDEWISSGGKADIIPVLMKKTSEEARELGYNEREVRKVLLELWRKQKSVYQGIMRTVTINAYATGFLEELDKEGVEEVERHCINDAKTCPVCKALCTPGRNIYKVKDLLMLDNPVTHFSHPQCRDFYVPVVSWDNLDEFLFEPIADISTEKSEIKNIPLGFSEEIKDLNERITLEENFIFVPEVVDTDDWWNNQIMEYEEKGYSKNEAETMSEIDKENLRGTIATFEMPDYTLLSGKTIDSSSLVNALIVNQAKEAYVWADKSWWKMKYSDLETSDKPFVNEIAKESPENLFIEEFIMFHNEPFRLFTLDRDGYEEISEMLDKDFL